MERVLNRLGMVAGFFGVILLLVVTGILYLLLVLACAVAGGVWSPQVYGPVAFWGVAWLLYHVVYAFGVGKYFHPPLKVLAGFCFLPPAIWLARMVWSDPATGFRVGLAVGWFVWWLFSFPLIRRGRPPLAFRVFHLSGTSITRL